MSIHHHSCVTVRCDRCGNAPENDAGGDIHFDSFDEARQVLAGDFWRAVGEQFLCGDCVGVVVCETDTGHDWTAWESFGQAIRGQVSGQYRSCQRCGRQSWKTDVEQTAQ
jgi:ribosomal protein L37E